VADGRTALDAAGVFKPHLVLIDCRLPGIDGSEVARRLRHDSDVPIIFVTAADAAEDVHGAFRVGADDYIVKPFDPEELSWRVRAVLRRSGQTVTQVWDCGELVVDELTRTVTQAGTPVELTATEFKLLSVLVRNRSRVVPKGKLLGQIWGYDADPHLLEVHMSSLRRKMGADGHRMIQTVRGTGYLLRPWPPDAVPDRLSGYGGTRT